MLYGLLRRIRCLRQRQGGKKIEKEWFGGSFGQGEHSAGLRFRVCVLKVFVRVQGLERGGGTERHNQRK